MSDFKYLLQRYLERRETEGERLELMKMIASGKYEDVIKNEIDGKFDTSPSKTIGFFDENIGDSFQKILDRAREREKEHGAVPMYKKGNHHAETRDVKIWWIAAAASLAAVVIMSFLWLREEVTPVSGSLDYKQTAVEPTVISGESLVHLPDGSTVILKGASELRYDETFGLNTREVVLEGEAFFDVVHDPSHPFIVHTGEISTTVLGTAFNINTDVDGKIQITVIRGKVAVGDNKKIYDQVIPNQQIEVSKETYRFTTQTVNAESVVAWTRQLLIFDNITLEEVAKRLSEHYKVNVKLASPALKNCRVEGTFSAAEGLENVLALISQIDHFEHRKDKQGNIELYGRGCK